MTSAITTFPQFHMALNGLANHPSIGVVPSDIVKGSIVFAPIDELQGSARSLLNVEFSRMRPEWDVAALAGQFDDEELAGDVGMLRSVLDLKAADLLPVDTFYRGQAASELAARRGRMASQIVGSFRDPEGEIPANATLPEFSSLTVGLLAERLAKLSFLHGGGFGHADLAKSMLTRAHLQRHNAPAFELEPGTAADPADVFFAAGVLFANMGAPWSLEMAEFSFAAAAQEFLGFKSPREVAAAVAYGLAADMRDRRAGGIEQYNPMRSAEASQWLKSIDYSVSNPTARIAMGLASSLRAGRMDLYGDFASFAADVAHCFDRWSDFAGGLVREAMGLSMEDGPVKDEPMDIPNWLTIVANLSKASEMYRENGQEELAEDIADLASAGAGLIPG